MPIAVKSIVLLVLASLVVDVNAHPHWVAMLQTWSALLANNITPTFFDPEFLVHGYVNRKPSYSYHSDLKRY
jgi:hypothetical protein